jgi:hypothetical protein
MAFRVSLTVSNAVRDGTRILSAKGDDPDADCITLQHTVETLSITLSPSDIDRIEIYRANGNGTQVASETNTYRFIGTDPADCDDWTGTILWPSAVRQVVAGSTPLDIVGVRVVYDTGWISGFPPYSGDYEVNRTTISRIEPEVFE